MGRLFNGASSEYWINGVSVISGNARHVLNGNADATRPTYDINTGRVTFISANSTFLQSAAFGSALSQPNTIFIVYKIGEIEKKVDLIYELVK